MKVIDLNIVTSIKDDNRQKTFCSEVYDYLFAQNIKYEVNYIVIIT